MTDRRTAACFAASLLAVLTMTACATTPHRPPDKNLLSFIEGPPVTRAEIYARLGQPHATFESDRIAAFRLGESAEGYYVIEPDWGWHGVRYNLMLEFDSYDVLQSHHLILIRAP